MRKREFEAVNVGLYGYNYNRAKCLENNAPQRNIMLIREYAVRVCVSVEQVSGADGYGTLRGELKTLWFASLQQPRNHMDP
eukprot:125654-Pyramimonas_sp.AAC.1